MPLRGERDPEEHESSVRSGQTNTNASPALVPGALRKPATCRTDAMRGRRESFGNEIDYDPSRLDPAGPTRLRAAPSRRRGVPAS